MFQNVDIRSRTGSGVLERFPSMDKITRNH